MNSQTTIHAADLFCGAGGFSSGLIEAARALGLDVQLLAINHWDVAIATHTANHPGVSHLCESVEGVNPRKVVPGGRLHLLMASPECTHHSNARGGKPMSDQSRATAWHILRWAEALYIDNILIENVREFRDWGPLGADGRPLRSGKGKLYGQFLRSLRALGYTVDDRLLNAAHYGDATTRQRLFIQARRGRKAVTWPEPTHLASDDLGMYPNARPWRTAREIIDWSIPGTSIYGRKKPLAPNTLARIMAGLRKYSGLPFLVGAGGPQGAGKPQSVDEPLGTVMGANHRALIEPFLVVLQNNRDAVSLDKPLPTVLTSGAHFGLCEPFIMPLNHGKGDLRSYSLDKPMPTVTSVDAWGLCQPFLIKHFTGSDACSVDKPLPAITANYEHLGLIQPFLVPFFSSREGQEPRTRSIDQPVPTVCAQPRIGLARPFLVKYHGNGQGACSVDDPLDTITARDRFGLVEAGIAGTPGVPPLDKGDTLAMLDIRFRMLQPHELAAAMSFPEDYQFSGNREQKVKQIGNAVPVRTAQALCQNVLGMGVAA